MRSYSRQTGLRQWLLRVARYLPKRVMLRYALKQVYRFRHCSSGYYCNFLGKAIYKRGLYRRAWFQTTEPCAFEKVTLRVPTGLHDFLTERFGNYMVPPSADRIKWEQHAERWDTEHDFSLYSNKARRFDDERKLA